MASHCHCANHGFVFRLSGALGASKRRTHQRPRQGFMGVVEISLLDLPIAAPECALRARTARFHLPTRVVRQMWPVRGVYER